MTTRERRVVFGEVADDYDRVRPTYPARMIDEVLAAAGPGPVLEVGAGTGKATALLAPRVADLTCIEPDPRMGAVLRKKLPGVRVIESTLEDWAPDRAYGLLVSGQAWHWVSAERRAGLAHAALAPGGLFAPFWNTYTVLDPALHAALAEVDGRHDIDPNNSHGILTSEFPEVLPFDEQWPGLLPDDGTFTDRQTWQYRWPLSYATADYRILLMSISAYRMLDPERAAVVLDEVSEVLDAHGGAIDFEIVTSVAAARRV